MRANFTAMLRIQVHKKDGFRHPNPLIQIVYLLLETIMMMVVVMMLGSLSY